MEVTFDKASLYQGVHAVAGALNQRAPRPSLQCIHLEAEGGEVVVSATDMQIAIRYTVTPKKIKTSGAALVHRGREVVIPLGRSGARGLSGAARVRQGIRRPCRRGCGYACSADCLCDRTGAGKVRDKRRVCLRGWQHCVSLHHG